ncbi:MAG: ribonuclease HII [Pseudazoarcus pumilus]|nr:ribonuclease HII [Pseudazoarcus pumilus]
MSQPLVCGVDEAGRGPLCGSVVAAAVILDPANPIAGLNDSKKLTAKRRERLAEEIRSKALAWAVAEASVEEIDRINILHASMLAMSRAVAALTLRPDVVKVDGNRCPDIPEVCEAIVGGDALVAEISAASILAKTVRDAAMVELDREHPQYGFARHKGYPVPDHLAALRVHGVLACHRRSFGPVRALLAQASLFGDPS